MSRVLLKIIQWEREWIYVQKPKIGGVLLKIEAT